MKVCGPVHTDLRPSARTSLSMLPKKVYGFCQRSEDFVNLDVSSALVLRSECPTRELIVRQCPQCREPAAPGLVAKAGCPMGLGQGVQDITEVALEALPLSPQR